MKRIDEVIEEVMDYYPTCTKEEAMSEVTEKFFNAHGLTEFVNYLGKIPYLAYLFVDDINKIKVVPEFDLRVNGLIKHQFEWEATLADNYNYLRECLFEVRYKFVPNVTRTEYYKWVEDMQGKLTDAGWQTVFEIIVFDDTEASLVN